MRAAGGWQSLSRDDSLSVRERRHHVPPVELRGGCAIEGNEPDVGMDVKERAKVVRDRIVRDGGIETA